MNKYILILLLSICIKAEAQFSALTNAEHLFATGNYSKAIEAYKKQPNQSAVFSKIAKAYIAIGNYDEALVFYQKSIEANPNNLLYKLEYGKLLFKVKKYEDASLVFDNLIKTDSVNPNYYYHKGLCYAATKDTLDNAQKMFKKAFALDNKHQKVIAKLARWHLVKRQHSTVDYYTNLGLKNYANNKTLISIKAQNYYWKEEYENAAKWFEKLIALNENKQSYYEKLSFCYAQIYENKKAIEYGLKALKMQPNNTTNLIIQSQLYLKEASYFNRKEDYDNAEKYITLALNFLDQPLHAEYLQLASIYGQKKQYDKAINYTKIAIDEDPTNDYIHYRLLLLKSRYYKDDTAKLKVYEGFVEKFPNSQYVELVNFYRKKIKESNFLKTSN